MKEARPQHNLTYVCRVGRTLCANANGGVVLLRPLHREALRELQVPDYSSSRTRGEVAEAIIPLTLSITAIPKLEYTIRTQLY